jgi:chromosome segregation ATPase
MSRIEIPMEEYQGLKDKIKSLESSLIEEKNQISIYKQKFNEAKELFDDLKSEGFINRLFNWKRVIKPFNNLFYK